MHEIKAELAGERSGHVFYGGEDYYGFDDAMFVAAKFIEYMSYQEETLSEIISSFPKYVASPEIKAYCRDDLKYEVADKITAQLKVMYPGKVCDISGARVEFENGWGLARASSNMPEIVLIFEGTTYDEMLKIRKVFKDVLSQYPEISEDWKNDVV